MSSESEAVDWEAPTRVTGEWVTVDRALSRNDGDVIATMELHAEADRPVRVTVVDEAPAAWSVVEVGVHPKFVPERYATGGRRFEFTDTVSPDEPLEVVYGFQIEAVGDLEPPGLPTISEEALVEDDEESEDSILGGTGPVFEESDDPPAGPGDEPTPTEDPTGDGAADDAGADGPAFDESRSASETGSFRERFERARDAALTTADGAAVDEAPSAPPDAGDDRPVAERLAEELADDVDDETLAAIRSALGVESSRRDEVQVGHLQSRVEEFAAYADTLGDLIDEHGPPGELLADHDARLRSLGDDVDGVRSQLDEVADERAALADRLDAVDERLEDLDGRLRAVDDVTEEVESLRTELDQLRRQHGDDVDDLSSALDGLESSLDDAVGDLDRDVDGLRGDLEAVRANVKEWQATRARLADEFAPSSTPSLDDE